MKIFLHIGTENTGTTSIQNFLSKNRTVLIKKGIYYPEFDNPNHISLPIFASENHKYIQDLLIYKNIDSVRLSNFKTEFKRVLKDEMTIIPKEIDTIILSNEHCSSRLHTEYEISNLKGLLDKFSNEIKIIVYLRRQDEFLLTHYNVCIKYGNKQSFEEFYQNRKKNYESGIFNYLNLVNKWSLIFGKDNLIIKIFEKDELYNKSVINDFMKIFNIDDLSEFNKCQDLNISLNPKAREFLRNLNSNFEIFTENKLNPVREKIYKIIEKLDIEDNNTKENPKNIEQFYTLFEDSNKQIAREYFKRESLFTNQTKAYNTNELGEIFELDLISTFEIFSKVIIEYENEINKKNGELNLKTNEELNLKTNELKQKNFELEQKSTELKQKSTELKQILDSNSWKITRPLRSILKCLKIFSLNLVLKKSVWYSSKAIFHILPLSGRSKERLKKVFFPKFHGLYNTIKASEFGYTLAPGANKVKTTLGENRNRIIQKIEYEKNKTIPIMPVKILAFYLPQFHAIPENDAWWGEGFTEWTNVKPAQPQFEDHYQPHIPGELGYYNLLDVKIQERQVELAKNYGIGGFCFHYYWFNGKRLLEKPIENYLINPQLDLPFCISWANENWTRRWDGRENEILIKQNHSSKDDLDFIKHISKYMFDKRYIRINNKPLLIVYRPGLLPSAKETAESWRKWCRENGLGEIYLAYVQSFEKNDPAKIGYDAAIEFPPNNFYPPIISHLVKPLSKSFKCNVYDWKPMVDRSFNYSKPEYKLFRGVCPAWDNTPRRKSDSTVFINSHPDDFQKWVYNAAKDTISRFENPEERLVFVNAWNEWAEGAHLEPDEKYGYAYLQNIYDVLRKLANTKQDILTKNNV